MFSYLWINLVCKLGSAGATGSKWVQTSMLLCTTPNLTQSLPSKLFHCNPLEILPGGQQTSINYQLFLVSPFYLFAFVKPCLFSETQFLPWPSQWRHFVLSHPTPSESWDGVAILLVPHCFSHTLPPPYSYKTSRLLWTHTFSLLLLSVDPLTTPLILNNLSSWLSFPLHPNICIIFTGLRSFTFSSPVSQPPRLTVTSCISPPTETTIICEIST